MCRASDYTIDVRRTHTKINKSGKEFISGSGSDMIIEPAWLRPEQDFAQISLPMAKALGWDKAAIVSRMAFRTHRLSTEAVAVDGYLWWRASLDELGEELGLSPDQMRRRLRELLADGTVIREKHRLDGAGDQTYSYRINTGQPPAVEPPKTAKSSLWRNRQIEVAESPDLDVAKSPDLPLTQQVKETPQPPKGGSGDREDRTPMFDEFWDAYPKKVERDRAREEWFRRSRGAEGFSPAAVILAAREYAEFHARQGTDPKYIPKPSNWLHNGSFRDPLPAAPKPLYQRLN